MNREPRKRLKWDLILAFVVIIIATGVIYNRSNESTYTTYISNYPNNGIRTHWPDSAMAVILIVLIYLFIRYTIKFIILVSKTIKKGGNK